MAYQRTEYADKTLSMNSLADRKLKLQLGSLDNHKGSVAKEINREKKKLERELAEAESYMRSRLAVTTPEGRQLSPRLPRRYSTPPSVLTATLPGASDPRKSPVANRRRILSEGIPDPLNPTELLTSPTSPSSCSPTNVNLLKPPFNQPRRQSLPPIGAGGLVAIDQMKREELGIPRRDRRSSYGGARSPGNSSPISSGATTPRGLSISRKGSSLNELELQEVTAKVSRFLQKIDAESEQEKEKQEDVDNDYVYTELDCNESETIQDLMATETSKRPSGGTFHPVNFE